MATRKFRQKCSTCVVFSPKSVSVSALCDIPVNLILSHCRALGISGPQCPQFPDLKNHQCQWQGNARGGRGHALEIFFSSLINLSFCLGHYKQLVITNSLVHHQPKSGYLTQYYARFQAKIRPNWGGGGAQRKTTKGGISFFYRASGFKMSALKGEMTQITGEEG